MGYLKEFNYRIYRLKEAKADADIIIYNKGTGQYNIYGIKKAVEILMLELRDKNIDVEDFAKQMLGTEQKINVKKTIEDWIVKETILVENLGYKPKDKLVILENGKRLFNTYKKSKLLRDIEIIKNPNFPLIKELIMNLVGKNDEEYIYFINWIAWQIQNPLQRLPTSIILQGEHGTGKSMFCQLVLKQIFDLNFCEIGQSDINKEYNDYIMGKQLIVANEVIHNDNKFLVPDKLKNYVTDEYLSINRKFKDTIYVRNYAQWIFVTNNQVPLKIEQGDRRYSVFQSKKLVDGSRLIGSLIKDHQNEINNFASYLLSLKPEYNYVSCPIENQAKKDLIKASYNSVQEFYDFVLEMGGIDKLYEQLGVDVKINKHNDDNYILTQDFYLAYKAYCVDAGYNSNSKSNFTRNLKPYGFVNVAKYIEGKTYRVYLLNGIKK